MTREEALGKKGDRSLERAGINGLVNDIYDDFENRTCNNCKFSKIHKQERTSDYLECTNEDSSLFTSDISDTEYGGVFEGFGCNQWKSKDE